MFNLFKTNKLTTTISTFEKVLNTIINELSKGIATALKEIDVAEAKLAELKTTVEKAQTIVAKLQGVID